MRKNIPVEESFRRWEKNPAFTEAYYALEEEFRLAKALIEARSQADMTQEQVAQAMGTSQAAVARHGRRSCHAVHPVAQEIRRGNRYPVAH